MGLPHIIKSAVVGICVNLMTTVVVVVVIALDITHWTVVDCYWARGPLKKRHRR